MSKSDLGAVPRAPSGGARQESPMVDEMFDGMDVSDSVAVAAGGNGHEDSANNGAVSAKYKTQAATLLHELTTNDRTVHANFHNNFNADLFDDNDLE